MAKKKKPEKISSTPKTNAPRELIVIAKRDAGMRASSSGVRTASGVSSSALEKLLRETKTVLTPLFGKSEDALLKEFMAENPSSDEKETNLHLFYHVDAPDGELDKLCEKFLKNPLIDGAYIKPAIELPIAPDTETIAPNDTPLISSQPITDLPSVPPSFVDRQGYLDAAPGGIDSHYAQTLRGGDGYDVRIIDMENGWRFNHTDLLQNSGGLLSGPNSTSLRSENHGTAVLGVYSGDNNGYGIKGICPKAWAAAVSWDRSPANSIKIAADRLRPGDILLLEGHLPGPRHNFQSRADQKGYIAIEWWPDNYEAIRYASNKGVIVVSAAGNGTENLDDSIYDTRPGGFPTWWRNPFKRNPLDSGSIIVGAGAPPPNTHGRNYGPDRSRLGFSNYGSAVDAQGWGSEVTATGYGDLWQDPDDRNNRDRWFTDTFSGTSSASPIVVGALGSVQGYLKAHGRIPLTPSRARQLLRSTGTPQQNAPSRPVSQRIGKRPNLRQMIQAVSPTNSWVGVQFTGTLGRRQTKRWFTFRWPAHWHVLWTVVPTTPRSGAPQIEWKVQVERASDQYITYWISITNLTDSTVNVEGRYAVLGW